MEIYVILRNINETFSFLEQRIITIPKLWTCMMHQTVEWSMHTMIYNVPDHSIYSWIAFYEVPKASYYHDGVQMSAESGFIEGFRVI